MSAEERGPIRLSVPVAPSIDPPLTESERATLRNVADALIPATDVDPLPSSLPEFDSWLDRAVSARAEHAAQLRARVAALADVSPTELWPTLRQLDAEDPSSFQILSAVVAGAYLMHPTVMEIIGYPGQRRNPAPFDRAAEELSTGILDPVIERGPIYVPTPDA